ncbi:MAG: GNAT family N-acetyltransferase [Natronohydrobacter sp.]|nr:GNAT family N-acetyltransferase [Natronohydrobacter sp.]
MPDPEIRKLGQADVLVFKRIRLEALRTEPASFASSAEDWELYSDEDWRERLRMPVFVAFRSGVPVGIMGLLPQQARKMKHRATLIMVYVRATERGTGIAGRLLDTIARFAAENGISQIELNVSSKNARAIRFYERCGFREAGLIPAGMRDQGQDVDEIIMLRRLP